MKKRKNHKLKLVLGGAVIAALSAQLYISTAQAQQVKFTPVKLMNKDGKITDCGFDFIATTPNNYGIQGRALYNPYAHLDMDVAAGKLTLGVMKKLEPQHVWILTGPNAIQGTHPTHIFLYEYGKKVKNLKIPRKSFGLTLVDKMLYSGFSLMFQNKGNDVSIKMDIPPDKQTYLDFVNCQSLLYSQTYRDYKAKHGDVKCLLTPDKCIKKDEKKAAPAAKKN